MKRLLALILAFSVNAYGAAVVPNIFATQPSGNVPASYLDTDFALISNYNTFSNYLVDSGAANAYVVTFPAGTTGSLAAGLLINFKAGADNTGASTLAANGMTAKSITNYDASALAAGQIKAGAIVSVIYDGTQFKLAGQPGGVWYGNISGNAATATTAGTVTTAAQPNITSVGTLTGLTVSGAIAANGGLTIPTGQSITGAGTAAISGFASASLGAISGTTGTFSGAANQDGLTINTAYNAGTNVLGPNIVLKRGDGTTAALGSIGFYSNNGTKSWAVETNILVGDALEFNKGATNYAYLSSTGLAVTGTTSSTAFSGPLTGNVTGNVSGSSGSTTGNAATATTATNFNNGTSSSSGGTVTATTFSGALSGNASTATTAGTVTTAAQPNITSVGTLTSVTSSGAISGTTGTFTGNVKTNSYFNFTGANAGLSFTGSDGGVFSNGLAVTGTTSSTAFSGPLTGNVTGNVSGTAATVTGAAQSAITSVGTLTGLSSSSYKDGAGNLIISSTAPAIASGFGTLPSCTVCNNTAAFQVTIGSGGTASSGVITMPAAPHGWACNATPGSGGGLGYIEQIVPVSTTSFTIYNVHTTSGLVAAWVAGDVIPISCTAF